MTEQYTTPTHKSADGKYLHLHLGDWFILTMREGEPHASDYIPVHNADLLAYGVKAPIIVLETQEQLKEFKLTWCKFDEALNIACDQVFFAQNESQAVDYFHKVYEYELEEEISDLEVIEEIVVDDYLKRGYYITMPDDSVYVVSVNHIAMSRAEAYKDQFDGDVIKSLREDTLLLFKDDHYEVSDWAKNNMNWEDVKQHAHMVKKPDIDFDDGWVNGDYEVK